MIDEATVQAFRRYIIEVTNILRDDRKKYPLINNFVVNLPSEKRPEFAKILNGMIAGHFKDGHDPLFCADRIEVCMLEGLQVGIAQAIEKIVNNN